MTEEKSLQFKKEGFTDNFLGILRRSGDLSQDLEKITNKNISKRKKKDFAFYTRWCIFFSTICKCLC